MIGYQLAFLIEILVLYGVPESEEKDGLELIPLPEIEVNIEIFLIIGVSLDIISPIFVPRIFKMNIRSF